MAFLFYFVYENDRQTNCENFFQQSTLRFYKSRIIGSVSKMHQTRKCTNNEVTEKLFQRSKIRSSHRFKSFTSFRPKSGRFKNLKGFRAWTISCDICIKFRFITTWHTCNSLRESWYDKRNTRQKRCFMRIDGVCVLLTPQLMQNFRF